MKKNLLLILFTLLSTLALPAVSKTIQTTAGTLSTLLTPTEQLTITDLSITGSIDARDMKFLRDNLKNLTSLNLGETTLLAYTGTAGTDSLVSSYLANELPSKSFDRNVSTSADAPLRSVVLPKGLMSVGFGAFIDCQDLVSVTFPATLTKIGSFAFFGCTGLGDIVLPASLKTVGDYAFSGCTGLTHVSIPSSVTRLGDWTFANCTALPVITLPASIGQIGSHTFYGCTLLTEVNIPVGITSIGEAAFARCESLTSITLPSTVNVLGESLFSGCTKLAQVSLPAITDSIPDRAFSDCDALTNFTIPASVTYMGQAAFNHCSNLSAVAFSGNLAAIGEKAFESCVKLSNLSLPSSITAIKKGAFSSCTGLTSLTISPSVKRVEDWAFFGCTGLTQMVVPSSLDSIGAFAFANCTGMVGVTFEGAMNTLAEGVFSSCSALTTVRFPASVTVIDKSAFANCAKLSRVVVPNTVKTIGEGAFSYCTVLTDITLPVSVTTIGKSAFSYCTSLSKIVLPSSVSLLDEGVFANCTKLTDVTLPSSLKSIGYRTFTYCTGLTGLVIPASVTLIESSAFSYCSNLASMELPASVTTIGAWAYLGCTNLARISIPATVKSIGSGAFYNCGKLVSFTTQVTTPLPLATNVFYSVSRTACVLNVPANTAEAYRKTAVWSEFSNIVELAVPVVGIEKSQDISLAAGWNVISGNVAPVDNNISTVFGGLATAGTLRKVMDEAGLTYERVSAQKGWVNSIGNFGQTEGYKVYMKTAAKLTIKGQAVALPMNTPLKAGWNIVSCPFESEQDALMVFQHLIQSGTLSKVMDEAGNTIENYGTYGGWRNTIGNLKPGKGYLVSMVQADTLVMANNLPRAATVTDLTDTTSTTHFIKAYIGNGLNHMNINLVDLGATDLQVGDEIGIFDGTVCVGSTVLLAENSEANSVSVITSCNDGLASDPNGFIAGNQLRIMAFSKQNTYELSTETLWGSETFEENGSLFAKVTSKAPVVTGIHEAKTKAGFTCFPNPFTEVVTINIEQEAGSRLVVELFNLAGQRVIRLFDGISSGSNHFTWNGLDERGRQVPNGSYVCRFNGFSSVILRSGK